MRAVPHDFMRSRRARPSECISDVGICSPTRSDLEPARSSPTRVKRGDERVDDGSGIDAPHTFAHTSVRACTCSSSTHAGVRAMSLSLAAMGTLAAQRRCVDPAIRRKRLCCEETTGRRSTDKWNMIRPMIHLLCPSSQPSKRGMQTSGSWESPRRNRRFITQGIHLCSLFARDSGEKRARATKSAATWQKVPFGKFPRGRQSRSTR